ncbi:MAG TPA: hypothetical protein VLE02_01705 [Nitrosarchaeum sp.]|nr:hypothetical protein [Nitrosarchaeum sp.]
MDYNFTVWDYYPDKYFVDALYLPYARGIANSGNCISTDNNHGCPYNPYQDYYDKGDDASVNRNGYRTNLGMSFQVMHPDMYKSCPEGWIRGNDGFCFRQEPNWSGDLYTNHGFLIPRKQYWQGYTQVDTQKNHTKILNNFDQKSVLPSTGKYRSYSTSKPYEKTYNKNPSSYNFFAGK